MIFDVNRDSGKLFATLPSGDQTSGDQTGRHECLLTVCDNPTCRCRSIYLKFIAQKPAANQQKGDQPAGDQPAGDQQNVEDTAPSACVDLATNGVDAGFRRMASPQDIDFSEKLVAEMDPQDFSLLGQLHFVFKNLATEEAKPDTIDPQFDFTSIESSSTTQGYNAILPFGDRLHLTHDGVDYALLDRHCVRTDCGCSEVYIGVLPITPDGKLGTHVGTIQLDYARRQWKTTAKDDAPFDVPAWRQRIETAIPDFYAHVSRRHTKLKAIYAHSWKRHLATTRITKTPPPKKIGRNDLCPCGSGKKYKKCCMA